MAKGTPNSGINGTLADGLLAHYSFNDGSLEDSSGNGNDAMAVGTPDLGVDKDGQEGQAVRLADKTYIYSGNLLQGSPEISGSLMFKTSKDSVPLIHFTNDLSLSSISDFVIFVINMGLYVDGVIDAGINLTDYTYHHLVFLSNETGLDLYLDKKYIGKVTQGINNYTYIRFGTPNYNYGERIIVDEIRLYNRRLTGETSVVNQEPTGEIAEIFTMGANYEPLDITPPTFNTINTSNITSSSVDLNINCSENATAYYKLYDRNATAPTPAELKTTHDKTIALTANNLITENITGLTALKDYDLYVVAEDTVGNLQALPTKINFSTISNIVKGTPNEGINGTLGNGLLAHWCFNDGSLQDVSGNGRNLIAVGNPSLTADKDGQANQALRVNDSNYLYVPSPFVGKTKVAGSFIFKVVAGNSHIFSIADSPNSGDSKGKFYVDIDGNLGIYNNSQGNSNTNENVLDGNFHQLVFNAQTDGTYIFLDNKYIGKFNQQISNGNYNLYLGKFYVYSGGDIVIDEIRTYGRQLTGLPANVGDTPTGEIAEIFTMGANYQTDIEPPTFNTINTSNITASSVNLNINCNENATAYYKLLNRGATAPTSAELKAAHDAEIVLTANVLTTIEAAGLSPSTDYDLYVVAEDTEHNLQVTPTKISFSTTIGKISEIEFNIDFDKTQLGTFIEVKYLDIKASGGSILYKNPIVKYWTNSDKTVRVFNKEVETFGDSTDLYFQIECDGYESSDVIHKELKMISIDGYQGAYDGGLAGYAKYDNDNYKKSEARILIPLTNTSFISYKK